MACWRKISLGALNQGAVMWGGRQSAKIHRIWIVCALTAGAVALAPTPYSVSSAQADENTASSRGSPEEAEPGSNDDETYDDEDYRLMMKQRPLSEASYRLQTFVRERELPGYAGGMFDTEAMTFIWYWKGEMPQELADLIRDLEQDLQITIDVRLARYSAAEVGAEARRILSLDPQQTGVRMRQAGPLSDYSGLRIGVHPADLDKAPQAIKSRFKLKFFPGYQVAYATGANTVDPPMVSVGAGFGLLVWLALGRLMYRAGSNLRRRRSVRPAH